MAASVSCLISVGFLFVAWCGRAPGAAGPLRPRPRESGGKITKNNRDVGSRRQENGPRPLFAPPRGGGRFCPQDGCKMVAEYLFGRLDGRFMYFESAWQLKNCDCCSWETSGAIVVRYCCLGHFCVLIVCFCIRLKPFVGNAVLYFAILHIRLTLFSLLQAVFYCFMSIFVPQKACTSC